MLKHLLILSCLVLTPLLASAQSIGKLTNAEHWHRVGLQREVSEAQRRFNAVQEMLDLFLAAPPEKQVSGYADLITSKRADVERYAAALKKAQDTLDTFDTMLTDTDARKVWNKRVKEEMKQSARAAQATRSYSSITIICTSYRGRTYSRTRCAIY